MFQKSQKEKKKFVPFVFLLQENIYSCLGLKFQVSKSEIARGHKIINLAAKVRIFKTLITSKLIDLET